MTAEQWEVYAPEGEVHANAHPHSYSICVDSEGQHKCIALVFGKTDKEAAKTAEFIVRAAHVREAAQHNEANLREAVRRKQVKDSIIRELWRKLAELEKALRGLLAVTEKRGDAAKFLAVGKAETALASLRAESKEG